LLKQLNRKAAVKAADSDRKRMPYTIQCKHCGEQFRPFNTAAKYCSYECVNADRPPHKEPKAKICIACGNKFIPWRSTAKYCSHKCAGTAITSMGGENKSRPIDWERKKASGKSNHLDNLWRFAVYNKAGNICEYCGISGQMNAHHVFSRCSYSTRWNINNGVCLCVSHHIFGNHSFHKSPAEMIEWLKEKRGQEWYDKLLLDWRTPIKPAEAKEKYYQLLKDGQYDKKTLCRMDVVAAPTEMEEGA
jgi:hypothetical protein